MLQYRPREHALRAAAYLPAVILQVDTEDALETPGPSQAAGLVPDLPGGYSKRAQRLDYRSGHEIEVMISYARSGPGRWHYNAIGEILNVKNGQPSRRPSDDADMLKSARVKVYAAGEVLKAPDGDRRRFETISS